MATIIAEHIRTATNGVRRPTAKRRPDVSATATSIASAPGMRRPMLCSHARVARSINVRTRSGPGAR
jgi:hypothetical protein